ncbi:NtrZ family periplasmic regulatory protein [Brevundimonas sp.]|uniref:NtrZ family periplasmic regulatory protein n=1 Tax=Brevundimonas sp. TaxID=1871086 RepID=UPI0035643A20
MSLSEAQAAQRNASAPQRRGLRLNDNGRWGLDFNLNQPVGRETDWGDVEAGAYYRLNDRLRVGAAAAVGAPEADPARAPETNGRAQPRVRLETIFKF